MQKPIAPPSHIKMEAVVSSNLAAVGYHAESQCLQVRFKSGAVWRYQHVPQSAYDGLINAGSIGAYFYANIRGAYPEEKVDG